MRAPQARLRMVLAFMLAQLLPWVRGRTGARGGGDLRCPVLPVKPLSDMS
jgi:hypothetical protein